MPEFISWKDRDALIIHSDKGIETHRSAIGESLITPNRNVYIRNNMPTMTDQQIGNRNNWTVSIEGVKKPKTFTLAQLKKTRSYNNGYNPSMFWKWKRFF